MSRLFWIFIALALTSITAESPANNDHNEDAVVTDDDNVEDEKLAMNIPGTDQKLPSPAELLKMLDSMGGMSDEEKENLREHLMKQAGNVGDDSVVENLTSASFLSGLRYQIILLLAMLSILGLIFGFFGYKLYKSLVAREIRREMKKKQKELKKKK